MFKHTYNFSTINAISYKEVISILKRMFICVFIVNFSNWPTI